MLGPPSSLSPHFVHSVAQPKCAALGDGQGPGDGGSASLCCSTLGVQEQCTRGLGLPGRGSQLSCSSFSPWYLCLPLTGGPESLAGNAFSGFRDPPQTPVVYWLCFHRSISDGLFQLSYSASGFPESHVQVGNHACQLAVSTHGESVLLPLVVEGSARCPGPGDELAGCGVISHTLAPSKTTLASWPAPSGTAVSRVLGLLLLLCHPMTS